MSMPTEYVDLLNGLNKEVRDKQPRDVKQFCANYFLNLLEEDRRIWLASKAGHHHDNGDPAVAAGATTAAAPAPTQALINPAGAPTFSRFNTSSFRTSGGENPDPHHKHDTNDDDTAARAAAASATSSHHEHDNSQSKTRIDNHHHHISDSQSPFPINFNANRRTSVSAESMNPGAISEAMTHISPGKQLPPEQLARLNKSVASNFLFSNLDEEALHSVLQSLQEKTVGAGSTIIKQGDEGDFFYIVESGTVDFYRDGEKVATSGAGSSFGELALMYNAPRAATVVATSECVLWALDRVTFRRILLEKTFSKRSMYEDFLREVPLLKVLNKYELSKLADALNRELYEPGDSIIKEGDAGEEFFIIENGTADVTKDGEGVVKKLSKGDYFGEVALLNDTPRQATVIATSRLKVVTLGKSAFQRLLGQAVNVLKRDDPTQPHH